ncbi:LysR family transcriptional regulator [Robbsia sp. Bb-Pol-6]|uniref:LysR family transcriptional regulator n=2 Tax=Robbsia betulipollinis TaxID=2981849 RepID=A0ABT3ZGV9_9BURK|nr:LysR family transcriptional regulator [Robbsia betulipollinis]MCY0385761.1 LysR family transcriptional regulator [Robbsia betulipollinis]
MRIRDGDHVAIGPGKIALLEAIHACGSISAAARHLGMSYRRAWLLLDELNRSLTSPAAISGHGGHNRGGCILTPVGERIVALYRTIEDKAAASTQAEIGSLLALVKR